MLSVQYTKASKHLDDFIAPCFSILEYKKTYQHCLHPVEGQHNWPISNMPRPLPPAYIRMPGRPKTQRTREPGEAPKGTKLSKVGIKMRCRMCQKTTHNSRTCQRNPEAGKKKNSYIKRDARKRKRSEELTSVAGTSNPGGGVGTQESSTTQLGRNNRARREPTQPGRRSTARGAPVQTGSSNNMSRMAHLIFGNNY